LRLISTYVLRPLLPPASSLINTDLPQAREGPHVDSAPMHGIGHGPFQGEAYASDPADSSSILPRSAGSMPPSWPCTVLLVFIYPVSLIPSAPSSSCRLYIYCLNPPHLTLPPSSGNLVSVVLQHGRYWLEITGFYVVQYAILLLCILSLASLSLHAFKDSRRLFFWSLFFLFSIYSGI
jgi:hypothetical protein